MITYERLKRDEVIAPSLIGMTLAAFDELYGQFAVIHQQWWKERQVTKRTGTVRRRATGAGAPHRYTLQDRLLMTLFWRHVHTTYAVVGFFYELDATNVEDNIKDVLATLAMMQLCADKFMLELSAPARTKLRSPQAVMDTFPEVRLLIGIKA